MFAGDEESAILILIVLRFLAGILRMSPCAVAHLRLSVRGDEAAQPAARPISIHSGKVVHDNGTTLPDSAIINDLPDFLHKRIKAGSSSVPLQSPGFGS